MRKLAVAFSGLAFAFYAAHGAMADTAAPSSPKMVRYLLAFTGDAVPDKSGKHLTVKESATLPSDVDSTVSGGQNSVIVNTLVTVGAKGTFSEKGTITFGGGTVMVQSAGPGRIGPSKIKGVNSGYVVWKVVGGTGVFVGASGFILSRFSEEKGGVNDGETALIYLK
ncbi:MAG: hypothetical protein HY243_02380 [Proteobacteria bacterium]|nr:hypothetical protein [Pseudomonadota bacterium]